MSSLSFAGINRAMPRASQGVDPPALPLPAPAAGRPGAARRLTQADAIDIWIARWLRIRRKDLLDRYRCDPRRLYEIWEGKRFAGSRGKALALFAELHPRLADRIDFGHHRRIPRAVPSDLQLDLFHAPS
jgi:hypothetical protein